MTEGQKADLIYEPYMKKLRSKQERMRACGGSLIERARFWIAHARSGLFYPATQSKPSEKIKKELMDMQAEVMETGGWIDKKYVMQVYQAVGIITTITTEQALELGGVLAVVREHGEKVLEGETRARKKQ